MFKLNTPPSELERLEFYRIQSILKQYEEHIDRENKEYKKQEKDAEKKYSSTSKPGSYGDFKPPKIEMPKINMPKY